MSAMEFMTGMWCGAVLTLAVLLGLACAYADWILNYRPVKKVRADVDEVRELERMARL